MRYVNFAKLVSSCFAVALLAVLCYPSVAIADIYRGYYTVFGEILTAREAAMGDCASTNVGADALFYNPGAYGVYFLNQNFEITAPIPQVLLPEVYDDFRVIALNAGVRFDELLFRQSGAHRRNWSLAIGVSHIRTTLPSDDWYWYSLPLDYDHMYSTGITVAAACNGRLRFGAGSTLKFLTSDLNNFGAALDQWEKNRHALVFDIGFYADFDLFSSHAAAHHHNWSVVPAVSLVLANTGRSEFAYDVWFEKDPVPHLIRYAASLKLTRLHEGREGISLRGVYELDSWPYEYYEDKIGGEAGLARAIFFRAGKVFTKSDYSRKPVTWGFGFSTRGFIDWAKPLQSDAAKGRESFWNRCDVRFDYGWYRDDKGELEGNTHFFRVTLAL